MTSKPRWGYKRSAMVLRPWIVQLLVRGDLKQRAQKVQVLQNVRGPRRSDGSVMKELTDGQAYIKAIFTAEAMRDYSDKCQDDSAPPSINDALLILTDYHIEFLPHECCHWSEFVVEVKRFTLWSYQEGFGLKQSPVNSMDNEGVKKKAVAMWKQWRETQARGNTLDSSLSSIPLSQLLDEMGMVSDSPVMEEDEAQPQGQDPPHIPQDTALSLTSGRKWPTLADYDEDCGIEDFIISEVEEKILAAIPEWQPGYQPQPTPTSDSCKSSGNASECQNTATLRKDCMASTEPKAKESRPGNGGVQKALDDNTEICGGKADGEDIVTAVDAEIQVSQSLWENFLLTARESRKDATTQACSQTMPSSQTHQIDTSGGHATTPHLQGQVTETEVTENEINQGMSSEAKQLNSSKKTRTSSVEALESTPKGHKERSGVIQTSPSLLSSPEEPRSPKKPSSCGKVRTPEKPRSFQETRSPEKPKRARKQKIICDDEPVVINDSFVEDVQETESGAQHDTLGKDKTGGSDGCKESKVKTAKDQNDNESPVFVDISSSQELSPEAFKSTTNSQNDLEQNRLSLNKTSKAKGFTVQTKEASLERDLSDVIMLEEQEEENRLHQLSKCSRSHSQGQEGFSGRLGFDEASCDNGELQGDKSLNTVANRLASPLDRSILKRRLSSSDSEISRSKKVFVHEQKILRERTCSSSSVCPNKNFTPVRLEHLSENDVTTVTVNQNERDTVDKSRLQAEASADVEVTNPPSFQHETTTLHENRLSKPTELTASSPDVKVPNENARVADRDSGTSVVLSDQSEQLDTNSLLNDAQIVSSGELMTSSGEQLISSGEQSLNQQTSKGQGKTGIIVASSHDILSEKKSPTGLMSVITLSQPRTTGTSTPPQSLSSGQPAPLGTRAEDSSQTTPSHSLPSYQRPPHGTHSEVSHPTTPSHSLPSYQPPPHATTSSEMSPKTPPVHSLPSYQPSHQQSSCTSKTASSQGSKNSCDKTFWGLLDSPPVSPAGRRLLEMSFSDGLMKKMEAYLSRM
ncbi:uncharacterized protein LOC135475052 [Liolophura sinensis]|uniref:uncharacterized protein LOC135475052 n=1 Tax=Liolophura sinensis TaxID=3198878 RepID=UPI00315884B5